jgi:protein-S-isoprenylcysteine O-methyltransferase Ste14
LGALLVLLTGIYAWATVAFGLRFSNLTHRGILTHGPYRWSRHPAYLSKNLFWWFSSLPFLAVSGSLTDMVRNCALMAATNGIYYWRAKTEEKHLSADPNYREYWDWMERNGAVPRAFAWMSGRRKAAPIVAQPAE